MLKCTTIDIKSLTAAQNTVRGTDGIQNRVALRRCGTLRYPVVWNNSISLFELNIHGKTSPTYNVVISVITSWTLRLVCVHTNVFDWKRLFTNVVFQATTGTYAFDDCIDWFIWYRLVLISWKFQLKITGVNQRTLTSFAPSSHWVWVY